MSGPFNTPPRARKPSINITPLIDVMFLLLIFFMVSSTFREYLAIDVSLPQATTAQSRDTEGHEITVTAEGEYLLGDTPVRKEELEPALRRLIEADAEAVFILKPHEKADFGRVVHVIDTVKKVGSDRLIIPTAPPDQAADLHQP